MRHGRPVLGAVIAYRSSCGIQMQLNPYLAFNGRCAEAFQFYAKCFGGEVGPTFTYEGSPMADHVPAEWGRKIMHASILVGDQTLMSADSPPGSYQEPNGFSVSIAVEGPEVADRIFNALAENGTVTLPIQKTFWSARFGMLVDQFGIPWMISSTAAG
jgi:PhnB protein